MCCKEEHWQLAACCWRSSFTAVKQEKSLHNVDHAGVGKKRGWGWNFVGGGLLRGLGFTGIFFILKHFFIFHIFKAFLHFLERYACGLGASLLSKLALLLESADVSNITADAENK